MQKIVLVALLGISLKYVKGIPLRELQAEQQKLARLMEYEENYMNNLQDYVKDSGAPV